MVAGLQGRRSTAQAHLEASQKSPLAYTDHIAPPSLTSSLTLSHPFTFHLNPQVGYKCVIHIHTACEECEVTKLVCEIDPKTKEQKKSRCVR